MLGKLADLYFTPRFWERSGKLYELLGIRFFKKYLPTTGDLMQRKVWRRKTLGDGRTKTLKSYERTTRMCEVTHLIFFFAYFSLFLVPGNTTLDVVSNLLVNVYPIMLQRYNRARLYRVFEWRRNKMAPTTQSELKAA